MKNIKNILAISVVLVSMASNVSAENATNIGTSASASRADFGWGGNGGASLEMYKKDHATRPGELRFVFGGGNGGNAGAVLFTQYDDASNSWAANTILDANGNWGMGTMAPCADCKLAVNGKIRAKEVVIDSGWADYVFDKGYTLRSLAEVEAYISENHHLPGVPTAADVQKNGINLSQINAKLLEKVEELTLYMIEVKKQNDQLQQDLALLKNASR